MPTISPSDEAFSLDRLSAEFSARAAAGPAPRTPLSPELPPAPPQASDGEAAFLARVLEDFRPDELPGVTASDLASVLAEFWRFGAAAIAAETDEAAPGDGLQGTVGGGGGDLSVGDIAVGEAPAVRLVRARGADGRDLKLDVLEIVQPDMPFLVDSVMGEVAEAGGEVKAMFHPIVGTGARPLSMIQVWLAPVGEERRAGLIDRLLTALADNRAAVADFTAMVALMGRCIVDLKAAAPGAPEDLAEELAFLRWADGGHFVFLGARSYEYPRTAEGDYAAEEPVYRPSDGLGVLRDPALLVLRRASEPAILSPAQLRGLETAPPVLVAKSNLRSRVHRRAYMDYIGVRRYGPDKKPCGEVRFVGLFTAQAYDEPARETPLLRRKLEKVREKAGFAPGSHNAMRLANILETYPRDELFQTSADEVLATALGILHLSDRPKVKLFVRRDPFDRFYSVLLFAPRERYDERLRERAGAILARAFGGRVSAFYPSFSDAALARVHYIIGVTPGDHREPDLAAVEAQVARAARTWNDDLDAAVRVGLADPAEAPGVLAAWEDAFPAGYRDRYDPQEALTDLLAIRGLGAGGRVKVRAFRTRDESPRQFRFKLYRRGEAPAALARVLPIVDHMGLAALVEEGHALTPLAQDGKRETVWVHDFLLEDEHGDHLSFHDIQAPFEAAFDAVWSGAAESDGFNRLVLELGATWREAALFRALARYRQQSGLDPSQAVQETALRAHPEVTRLILRLFEARFDPATGARVEERADASAAVGLAIEEALQNVESLDADRVLRRLAALVGAITRTNFYQTTAAGGPKPYISFKVASRELLDLPAPKPFREIYVSSPVVEGVHLRFGPVARGGLRWSDRRDDFRTEVLGLVKAQQVKNAVIVPVGSKGGFYPKTLPRGGAPDDVRVQAVRAYKIFLHGLLDLTDNIDAAGTVIHPPKVVIHDADDPYLVVAADKGTASFSDIANGVAEDYGFWLGDAFASGGSAGYDHKAMGITSRGAWEAVKRHFREMGKDIQRDTFTVAGVGDMSGDVFGNGMLLSKATRLKAAFDHRHIFLDPDPDPATSWAERKRLFDLVGSSWDDYDRAAISPGGGVFPRSLKSVPLSEATKAMLDVRADALPPAELITAILRCRVELLFMGGIGTYVKGVAEANLDVGDKANDAVRVNGRDLRCKVVGEGANLGLTQAGRIEFALAGGRIDTDAIDNSAGVDTSDHEVNIKILTGAAERAGRLDRADRDPLLASMTDDIARHVLAHNYDQTLALSLLQAEGADDLDAQAAFMTELEGRGKLDRVLEGLPDAAVLAQRRAAGRGLTRPELAVLLAYGKLELFDDIVASAAPDDPYFFAVLEGYFPKAMAQFEDEMRRHRLRREIIATVLDNELVNLCGPSFAGRLRTAAACDTTALITAFEAARQVLRFSEPWARVEKLDGKAPAEGQTALFVELTHILRGQTYWLARRAARERNDVQSLVKIYRPAVDALKTLVPGVLSPFEQKSAVRRAAAWIKAGAPKDIAHSVALMRPLVLSTTLTDLAAAQGWPLAAAAFVYHRVGGTFGFDRLRAAAASKAAPDPFERLAMRRLVEDMLAEQAGLAGAVMSFARADFANEAPDRAAGAVTAWIAAHGDKVRAAKRTVDDIEKAPGGISFAKLTLANAALRELTTG